LDQINNPNSNDNINDNKNDKNNNNLFVKNAMSSISPYIVLLWSQYIRWKNIHTKLSTSLVVTNQITIVIMEGATESIMDCVNIRMDVDDDEYIWNVGISNDGWKVASYILVRVLSSATHGILEGDLADELEYIEAQLNSSQQQPTPPLQPTLSNGSS
jgi:hypothetical protein